MNMQEFLYSLKYNCKWNGKFAGDLLLSEFRLTSIAFVLIIQLHSCPIFPDLWTSFVLIVVQFEIYFCLRRKPLSKIGKKPKRLHHKSISRWEVVFVTSFSVFIDNFAIIRSDFFFIFYLTENFLG